MINLCGEVRFENTSKKIGNKFRVENAKSGSSGVVEWSGFCRSERVSWWKRQSAGINVNIPTESFTEQGYEFIVPGGKLQGIILKKSIFVNGRLVGRAGSVKILTRKPLNEFEKSIHHRWPLVIDKKGKIVEFTKELTK